MKKLIAILVVFALVAGSAFAQASFSAGGNVFLTLLDGNTDSGLDDVGYAQSMWIGVSKTTEAGDVGAKFDFGGWYYTWWQPIDQLFIKLGKVGEDGKYWAGDDITGWGFQSNDLMISPGLGGWNGYACDLPSGYGFFVNGLAEEALQISIIPIDGLVFNFGWNIGGNGFVDTFKNIAIQATFTIPGAGTVALGTTLKNGDLGNFGGLYGWRSGEGAQTQLALQYGQGLPGGMKFEIGVAMNISDYDVIDWDGTVYTTIEGLEPLAVGVGFGYGSPWGDDFWLTARIAAAIPMEAGQDLKIGLGICPSYDLGIFRIYCPLDFGITIPDVGDAVFGWAVNPYIRKDFGGIELWTGGYLASAATGVDYKFMFGFLWAW